ncbi:MAG: UDP-N-acetylglucosamine 1-carboxyvinyltransferase [Nitrospirae bacterium GWC2_56_14]|nr:MAG: UDP-N-acetylglucosamine 1-carboxyvinyltransferase [Nitrospirae bacterium GWC2_56_14]
MKSIYINGGKKLSGEVSISGAKNAALPILAAGLLCGGKHRITNVPQLADVTTFGRILQNMGIAFERQGHEITIDSTGLTNPEAPYDLVRTMRASVLVLGPLVARMGKARVSLPGGCAIGARPINLHLMGLEKLGATVEIEHGYVVASAKKLRGAHICFDTVTVTGTENLMMAAALAEGETTLENAAREPEIVDLAHALIQMGAKIEGAGTDVIRIQGVENLRPMDYTVMPDRIETGTFVIAAAITNGDILIKNCFAGHLDAVISKVTEAGAIVTATDHTIHVQGQRVIRPVNVKTLEYPGFPTDMQAQIMSLMALADGASMINETIFENRFTHVAELRRMGADIQTDGRTAIIKGVPKLSAAPVMATDLRASASLILAGLAAEGQTVISRIYHLDRGYDNIEQKLSALGADIRRA